MTATTQIQTPPEKGPADHLSAGDIEKHDAAGPLRLAIIIGSTRSGRFGPVVSEWFARHARRHTDIVVDVIDLAEARLPERLTDYGEETPPEVTAVSPRLHEADVFVVVTPEYNHSFPAPLKTAIDWHHKEWQAKPVGFVSYGGRSGGLRAVEQLRLVFAELNAVSIRETISFHSAWEQFDNDGRPKNPEACGQAATALLKQLTWWGRALRTARTRQPYGA